MRVFRLPDGPLSVRTERAHHQCLGKKGDIMYITGSSYHNANMHTRDFYTQVYSTRAVDHD